MGCLGGWLRAAGTTPGLEILCRVPPCQGDYLPPTAIHWRSDETSRASGAHVASVMTVARLDGEGLPKAPATRQ